MQDGRPGGVRAASLVRGIGGREAVKIAHDVNGAFIRELRALTPGEWMAVTDCDPWTVKDIVCHVLGWAEFFGSASEARRQIAGTLGTRSRFRNLVDAQNEFQAEQRRDLSGDELVYRLQSALPRFVRFRSRAAAVGKFVPFAAYPTGRSTVRFLMNVIFTRDVFMHRVDVSRATGREMALGPSEARIVEDLVRHWEVLARPDVRLDLTGPLGGRYVLGDGGRAWITADGVELARLFAGRADLSVLNVERDEPAVREWLERPPPF